MAAKHSATHGVKRSVSSVSSSNVWVSSSREENSFRELLGMFSTAGNRTRALEHIEGRSTAGEHTTARRSGGHIQIMISE